MILTIDGAAGQCMVALVENGAVVSQQQWDGPFGQASKLPSLLQGVLATTPIDALAGISATVGPGSFTGIRAALSLAHGIAIATDLPLVGVTVGEALAHEAFAHKGLAHSAPNPSGRALWVATLFSHDHIVIEAEGAITAFDMVHLPAPPGPIAIAGSAANLVAAALAARGCDVMLIKAVLPRPADIASVGARRLSGEWAPLAIEPIYLGATGFRTSAQSLRPAPV